MDDIELGRDKLSQADAVKPWDKKKPWSDDKGKERWRRDNILHLDESEYPQFVLAKNKARFLRMVSWYKSKQEWLEIAPSSGLIKLCKQQQKELDSIRANKLGYEMDIEEGTLTPSQTSYRKDELKMCEAHERMAVSLMARMQAKIKSVRS